MAGLRVGYLLASPELVREVNKARLPYNLNFFSQIAALAALEEKEPLAGNVRRLVEGRERLLARLADLPGVRAHASRRQLLPARAAAGGPEGRVRLAAAARSAGARRHLVPACSSRCLRVSVGSEEENDAFLHALGTALGESGSYVEAGRA